MALMITAIQGRLTRDPEMVGKDENVAKFTVAVDDWDSAEKKKITQFYPCVAFGRQAETARDYLAKGREVNVVGKMRERRWESNEGEKRSRWELTVDQLHFVGPAPEKDGADEPPAPSTNPWG